MARRQSTTPLYEMMIRSRRADIQTKRTTELPTKPSGSGRAIRLPVGYVWLGAAGAVLVVVVAFSTGYLRGHRDATRTLEREWLLTNQRSLRVPPPEIAPGVLGAAGDGHGVASRQAGVDRQPSAVTPIRSDPRVKGVNYFVLIHTRLENATKLAQFCRDLDVEAYVVRAKNVALYHVVSVLPGYASGDRSSEPIRPLEPRLAAA